MEKLQPAEDYVKIMKCNGKIPLHKKSTKKLAREFVHGKVKEAIENEFEEAKLSDRDLSVMVNLPQEAYADENNFIAICQLILDPLGYKAVRSHSGDGIHTTLYIEWSIGDK